MNGSPNGEQTAGEQTAGELIDRVPVGLLSVDRDGVILWTNATLLAWTGHAGGALIGSGFTDLLKPGDQIFYETRYLPVLELQGELREVALAVRTADGGTLPVLVNARRDPDGGTQVAVFDATARQNYERELLDSRRVAEASEMRVRVLQEASAAFMNSESEQALADALAEVGRTAMAASQSAVVLADEAGGGYLAAGVHPLAAFARSPDAAAEIQKLRAAGTVVVPDLATAAEQYPGLVPGLRDARIEAFSIVPIATRRGTIGVLMCFFGRARWLTAEDVELQESLAQQAGQALARVRFQIELEQLALHDQLTGLANRTLLREELIRSMAGAARREASLALIFLDLDGFKRVNDDLGHQRGDDVLRAVSRRLTEGVRLGDTVGRFGGDEFVIVCPDAELDDARDIAERLRTTVRDAGSELPDGTALPEGYALSCSVGVAICRAEGAGIRPEEFFAIADAAMYRSKRDGKDRVTVAIA